jgi:hypothetical protein
MGRKVMKLLAGLPFLFLGWPLLAQTANIGQTSGLLSLPGAGQFVANIAAQVKAVGLVDLQGDIGGGFYLPVRTLTSTQSSVSTTPPVNYISFGVSGVTSTNVSWRPKFTILFNATTLLNRAEQNWPWYNKHVTKANLPNLWIGPDMQGPFPGDDFQWKNYKQYLGGIIGIGW